MTDEAICGAWLGGAFLIALMLIGTIVPVIALIEARTPKGFNTMTGFWRKYSAYVKALASVKNSKSVDPFCHPQKVSGDFFWYRWVGLTLILFPIALIVAFLAICKWLIPFLCMTKIGLIITIIVGSITTIWISIPYVLFGIGKVSDKIFNTKAKLDSIINLAAESEAPEKDDGTTVEQS